MYQKARRIPDLGTAYVELLRETEFSGDAPPVLNQDTLGALETYEEVCKDRETFWNKSWKYLYRQLPPEATSILHRHRIGAFSTLHDMSDIIGACDPSQLYLLHCRIPRGFEKGTRNALVLKFERLPGYMSSLLFLTSNTRLLNVDGSDPGLIGLYDSLGYRNHVIAMPNPLFYLVARKRWMSDNDSPPPFVCYPGMHAWSATADTWKLLHHSKVIFWDYDPVQCIRVARTLGERGYVATDPVFPSKTQPTKALAEVPVVDLHSRWQNSAQHWIKVLATQLGMLPPSEAMNILNSIGSPLSNSEKDRLKSHCTAEQWRRIRCLFDGDNSSHSFVYGNEVFVERPNRGWFRRNKLTKNKTDEPPETLISDAIIKLQQVTTVKKDVVLNGNVIFNGNQIPFSERERTIRQNPAEWLSVLCVSRELGYPEIHHAYRRVLLDMARQSSPPKMVSQVERVGWNPNLAAYVFPKFFIDVEGNLTRPDASTLTVTGIPGQRLDGSAVQPRPMRVDAWMTPSVYTEIAWALLTCVLANLLAVPMKKSQLGISLLTAEEPADLVLLQLGHAIGLLRFSPSKEPSAWEIEQILAMEQAHDLPAILNIAQVMDANWLEQLKRVSSRNVILTSTIKNAINLSMHAPWVGIRAGDKLTDCSSLEWLNEFETVIPYFLAVMLRRKLKLRSTAVWPLCVFDDLVELLSPIDLSPEQKFTLANARSRIVTWGCSNLYTRIQAILNYEKLMSEDGVFVSKEHKNAPIQDDVAGGTLTVNRDKLYDKLKANGWFLPADHLFDATFTHANQLAAQIHKDGWVLDRKRFFAQYEAWAKQLFGGSSNAL